MCELKGSRREGALQGRVERYRSPQQDLHEQQRRTLGIADCMVAADFRKSEPSVKTRRSHSTMTRAESHALTAGVPGFDRQCFRKPSADAAAMQGRVDEHRRHLEGSTTQVPKCDHADGRLAGPCQEQPAVGRTILSRKARQSGLKEP